jgi:hypothetical protein
VGNVYCWGGLRFDADTGLHDDDGGGYFDPQMGKWITSVGLPKLTPKLAKEHHGKFRMSSDNDPWSSSGTKGQDHNSSRSNRTVSNISPGGGSGGGGGGSGGILSKEFKGHVTLLKRGDSGGSSAARHTKTGHVTLLKRGDSGSSSARHTKTGHVTLLKRGDSGSSAIIVGGSLSSEKHTKTGHVTLMK